MTSVTTEQELPNGASSLIAVARVAHRDGNRALERAATDKLAKECGIEIRFTCIESVERDLRRAKGASR